MLIKLVFHRTHHKMTANCTKKGQFKIRLVSATNVSSVGLCITSSLPLGIDQARGKPKK